MKKLLTIFITILLLTLSGCYSCESWNNMWGNGPVEPGCEESAFFSSDCQLMAKAAPKVEPVKKAVPKKVKPAPKPAPTGLCGPSEVSRSYPCEGCEIIRLHKTMPTQAQLNAPFNYVIEVINATDMDVDDVVVTENIPANLTVKNANPAAEKIGAKLVWKLGSFAPNQTKKLTVSAIAKSVECVKTCAAVTYVVPACAYVQIVQPKLQLMKTAPAEVLLCQPIPVKFVVTNSGSGPAKNVKIEDILPAGLKTAKGQSKLVFDAGTLAPGQSRQFAATLKASKTGKYTNKAVANSAGGLKANSEAITVVRQPILTISKTAPKKIYLGRAVKYQITVANKGDAAAKNLVIEDQLPAGVKFVSASNNGKATANKVNWNLGTLAPGKSQKVSLTVMPSKSSNLANIATATAICAKTVKASVKTSVVGIPAVLLEVIDLTDPVEVGTQTTYLITATNQGTSTGTNVRIVCDLEDNEQYVSSSGATSGILKASTITFAPLKTLAPKAKASWRIVVKAVKPGDVRFKVKMNVDQFERPVEETEATHLYK
jgi:uncharacterized repeat protein (TIGR01451 family)